MDADPAHGALETAAMIIEPILGEGGFLTPPPSYLRGLRELCNQHGILLIIDEVSASLLQAVATLAEVCNALCKLR